jgi:transposase
MTDDLREVSRAALRTWRRRSDNVTVDRDPLVATAIIEAGLSIEEVHVITGLGRTTIDRIIKRAKENGEQQT